jgi:hypothetical protein
MNPPFDAVRPVWVVVVDCLVESVMIDSDGPGAAAAAEEEDP